MRYLLLCLLWAFLPCCSWAQERFFQSAVNLPMRPLQIKGSGFSPSKKKDFDIRTFAPEVSFHAFLGNNKGFFHSYDIGIGYYHLENEGSAYLARSLSASIELAYDNRLYNVSKTAKFSASATLLFINATASVLWAFDRQGSNVLMFRPQVGFSIFQIAYTFPLASRAMSQNFVHGFSLGIRLSRSELGG